MSTAERWRDVRVQPFSGWYEVSNQGRVRRVGGVVEGVDGKRLQQHELKPWQQRGQLMVRLSALGSSRAFAVARLVALAWVGRPPARRDCAYHRNGDRLDNRPENLEWRSASDVQMGGPEHPRSRNGWKLTPDDVRQIRALDAAGESAKSLARCYGVSDTNVRYIVSGRIWRSV